MTPQSDMTGRTIADILVRFADAQEAMGGGCSDGYCVVKRPQGMHTNGGCRCMYQPDRDRTQRAGQALRVAQEMADEIERLREQLVQWKELHKAIAVMRNFGDEWPDHGNAPLAIAAGYSSQIREIERQKERIAELEAGLMGFTEVWSRPYYGGNGVAERNADIDKAVNVARALLKGADE